MTGCEGRLSTLDAAGPAAQTIATLWWVMLAGAVAIFLLVTVLLMLAFRRQKSPQTANPDERRLERVWIIGLGLFFTMGLLAALLAYGIFAGEELTAKSNANDVNVQAQASQSGWRFSYADRPGYVSQNTLHIPANQVVAIAITTEDVIHSFWVPRLAGKLDAIPGHTNVLRLQADLPGRYAGRSAEYSGPGYLDHRFEVRAHDVDTWAAFLRGAFDEDANEGAEGELD